MVRAFGGPRSKRRRKIVLRHTVCFNRSPSLSTTSLSLSPSLSLSFSLFLFLSLSLYV